MSRDALLLLEDIRDAGRRIAGYVRGISFEEFIADPMRTDAVVRNLEVIGEAAKRLPKRILTRLPDQPWAQIRGMRNVLAHEYFRVDLPAVWETAKRELPSLIAGVEKLLNDLESRSSSR